MKTIDFKHFKMFKDISQESFQEVDLHRDYADVLYKNLNGLMAHDVAMRIYKSDGPIELSDEELAMIMQFAEQASTPIFIDSLKANLHD